MSTESNDAKIKQWEQQSQADDAAIAAAPKLFNPQQLFEESNKIKTFIDPVLGEIQYGDLTFADSFKFEGIEDKAERLATIAALMLQKADPSVTVESIKGLPLKEANALVAFVLRQPCFL